MNILLAVIGLGILCLLLEIANLRKAIVSLSVAGLLGVLVLVMQQFGTSASFYNDMIVADKFSIGFSGLFALLTLFIIVLSGTFYSEKSTKISDFISIKLFLLSGGMAMVMFGNLAMFFLGIEVLSIALYVLAASERLNIKSNEAGMKYFLMGSFASGIILFGIGLIYGATGTFNMAEIHELSRSGLIPDWFSIGLGMLLTGMLFKIAAVPFHFWAPDVYEGSPALTTATMSTLAKVVAMASLYKLVTGLCIEISWTLQLVIASAACASMIVGNIMALKQDNVKRMLAFSGISHAGYMLLILLATNFSAGTLLYYATAYALAGISAFGVILYVTAHKNDEVITHFNGLAKQKPVMAALLSAALLSMGGIPILAGFFAKLMVFSAVIEKGFIGVVIIAVLSSIISMGYYLKLILAMYTKAPEETFQKIPTSYAFVAGTAIVINLLLGLFPSILLGLME